MRNSCCARASSLAAESLPEDAPPPGHLRPLLSRMANDFRDKAPLSAAGAAKVILDGVRSGDWRILVGKDAGRLDEAVRAKPNQAYDYARLFSQIAASASNTASTD